jgi:hypothetical protein
MTQYVLSNFESFQAFFSDYRDGKMTDDVSIRFEPTAADAAKPFLYVKGDAYDCTINDLVMKALLSHQKNVDKLYSLVTYGKIKRLKDDELESVRLVFGVEEGSSIFDGINKDKILESIMSKVNGKQIIAVVVIGLLLYFTSDGVKYYLDKKYNQKDKELLLQVIREVKGGNEILEGHRDFSNKLKKIAKHADVVEFSGHRIDYDKDDVPDKAKNRKRLDGDYRILKLDAANDNHFSVRIENIANSGKFNAKLDQIISQPADLQKLSNSMFERKIVHLEINATFVDDKLDDAFVVSIAESKASIKPVAPTTD